MEKVVSIRGAITVKQNSVKGIKNATNILLNKLLKQNKVTKSKIINIIFTVTDDLDLTNPATIARKEFRLHTTPMLCVQEMKVKNGLRKCIRVMINVCSALSKEEVKHIYLGSAKRLRPDLMA